MSTSAGLRIESEAQELDHRILGRHHLYSDPAAFGASGLFAVVEDADQGRAIPHQDQLGRATHSHSSKILMIWSRNSGSLRRFGIFHGIHNPLGKSAVHDPNVTRGSLTHSCGSF